MYKIFLAFRFLVSRKINALAVLGVVVGVMAIIVVTSVMRGFAQEIRSRIRGTLSHVVVKASSVNGFRAYNVYGKRIATIPGVVASAPRFDRYGLLARGDEDFLHVALKGIDLEKESRTTALLDHLLVEGNDDLRRSAVKHYTGLHRGAPSELARLSIKQRVDRLTVTRASLQKAFAVSGEDDLPAAIVGFSMAGRGVEPGDEITLVAPILKGDSVEVTPEVFRVAGVFKTGNTQYDDKFIYIPIDEAQRIMLDGEERATEIGVRLEDYREARRVVRDIAVRLVGAPGGVMTWEDQQRGLLSAVEWERKLQTFILLFLLLLAFLLTFSLLTMGVTEKTRDIGTLKAVGATTGGVVATFVGIGLLIGVIGAVGGVAAGCAISVNVAAIEEGIFQWTGVKFFPRNIYYLDEVPHELNAVGIVQTAVAGIVASVLASLYPAWKAARMNPVESLRYE